MRTNLASLLQGGGFPENTAMNEKRYGPNESMPRKTGTVESFLDTVVGRRRGLRAILTQAQAVAPTDATVLITGETGTGKEVIARAVHELSPRRGRNMVNLNCAAMSEERSPARSLRTSAESRSPTVARCFSMKLGTCRLNFSPSSCVCCRNANSSPWAASAPRAWTSG